MRQELILYYLDQIQMRIPLDQEKFLIEYPYVAIHRIMQMLGAFGFLSRVKKKHYFANYIPAAVRNLKDIVKLVHFSPFKKLREVIEDLPAGLRSKLS